MEVRKYKKLDAECKIQALKEHIMDKIPISDICEKLDIQPSVFYGWQRDLFARGGLVFEKKPGPKPVDKSQERIAELEGKLAKKDGVIAELLQEHVELKKKVGLS